MSFILKPEQVREKYGRMFCKGLFTIVDEEHGMARIIEICSAKGPVEWDYVNRKRTCGIIREIGVEGNTLVMDTKIGEAELRFGPASATIGGQGVQSLKVIDGKVHTVWKGIAGAGVGIGACLPQAAGVIETIYPDDFKIGGAHVATTEIVTPKMVRVIVGVDDTDTKEKGASWVTSMKMGRECPYGIFLQHKIIQLNPNVPNKTTNCCSTAVSFAVPAEDVDKVIEYCRDYIARDTQSDDTVMTVYTGLWMSEEFKKWCWNAKSIIYTVDQAVEMAKKNNVRIINITGSKGTIGAVAAIGCFDLGPKSAGVPEDFN